MIFIMFSFFYANIIDVYFFSNSDYFSFYKMLIFLTIVLPYNFDFF